MSAADKEALPPFESHSQEIAYTESPHPSWTYGQKTESTPDGKRWLEGEEKGWTVVDPSKEDPRKLYALMISGIVPRPVAFVSSVSEDGVENLAPFSWFNMVTHSPPIISVSFTNTPGGLKDSARNIRVTKTFVVNIMSEPFIEQANITSIDSPPNVSEWDITGLTKVPSIHVKAPRVKESAFSMECEVYQDIDIIHPDTGEHSNTFILGLVKAIHVRNDVLNERGVVDVAKFKPIARLGDISYASLGTAFRLPRPQWAVVGDDVEKFLQGLPSGDL